MHDVRDALRKVARRSLLPKNPEPLQLPDYSQYIPNHQLKGKKLFTRSPKDQAKIFAMERISRLREYKAKSKWRVDELFSQNTTQLPQPNPTQSNFEGFDMSSARTNARFISANLKGKMNDYLNQMISTSPSSRDRPTSRVNYSHQEKRSLSGSIGSSTQRSHHKNNAFLRSLRQGQRRLQIRKEQQQQGQRTHLFSFNALRESSQMVKRASKLPPCETPEMRLTGLIEKDSPTKAYVLNLLMQVPRSRSGPRNNSLL